MPLLLAAAMLLFALVAEADEREAALIETIELVLDGKPDAAERTLAPLLEIRPRYRLAHLLKADLLAARAGAPVSLDRASRVAGADGLAALWAEAEQRWRYSRQRQSRGWPAPVLVAPDSLTSLFVVDTALSRLYRFTVDGGKMTLVSDSYASIGRNGAGKERAWDRRTPIGVYFVVDRIEDDELAERYGPLAFPVDYPNAFDRQRGRTGDGIWLHGIPRTSFSRPPLDSDGCVVIQNDALVELAGWIEPGRTPMIVTRDLDWQRQPDPRQAESLKSFIEQWRLAWANGDADGWLTAYADAFAPAGLVPDEWRAMKRRALSTTPPDAVRVSQLFASAYPDEPGLVVARFRLEVTHGPATRTTWKRLYLRERERGGWSIVATGNG